MQVMRLGCLVVGDLLVKSLASFHFTVLRRLANASVPRAVTDNQISKNKVVDARTEFGGQQQELRVFGVVGSTS
jgi:hypothetical protein